MTPQDGSHTPQFPQPVQPAALQHRAHASRPPSRASPRSCAGPPQPTQPVDLGLELPRVHVAHVFGAEDRSVIGSPASWRANHRDAARSAQPASLSRVLDCQVDVFTRRPSRSAARSTWSRLVTTRSAPAPARSWRRRPGRSREQPSRRPWPPAPPRRRPRVPSARSGATPSSCAAARNMSGWGLPCANSRPETSASKASSSVRPGRTDFETSPCCSAKRVEPNLAEEQVGVLRRRSCRDPDAGVLGVEHESQCVRVGGEVAGFDHPDHHDLLVVGVLRRPATLPRRQVRGSTRAPRARRPGAASPTSASGTRAA